MTFQPFEDCEGEDEAGGEPRLIFVRTLIHTHTTAGEPAFENEPLACDGWRLV